MKLAIVHGQRPPSDELGMKLLTIVRTAKIPNSRTRSFDQERREVLDSVLGAWKSAGGPDQDADRVAACRYLLRHLVAQDFGVCRQVRADTGQTLCLPTSPVP